MMIVFRYILYKSNNGVATMHKMREINWNKRGRIAGDNVKLSAAQLAKYILDNDTEKVKDNMSGKELLTLSSVLYCIVLDRLAFARLPLKGRDDFSGSMLDEIVTGLSDLWESHKDIKYVVGVEVNRYMRQLGQYAATTIPGKNEKLEGTLYWEYSRLLTDEHQIDPMVAVNAYARGIQIGIDLLERVKDILPE